MDPHLAHSRANGRQLASDGLGSSCAQLIANRCLARMPRFGGPAVHSAVCCRSSMVASPRFQALRWQVSPTTHLSGRFRSIDVLAAFWSEQGPRFAQPKFEISWVTTGLALVSQLSIPA